MNKQTIAMFENRHNTYDREMIGILKFIVPLLFLFVSNFASNAHAGLCTIPPEQGIWRNYNQNTSSITKLVFQMECRDASKTVCSGNICSTTSAVEPHFFINLYGKCHPTDCDWGRVEGRALTGSDAGWYYFTYNHGFARRYVYARTYPQWPGWFRLYVWTDFTDPGRADYASDEWFVR
jgi:hypothetical protein